MTKFVTFFFLISLSFFNAAFAADAKLTPFQKNIKQCLNDRVKSSEIKTLEDLYRSIDKAFPLRTNETVEREIVFTEKGESRKLKVIQGKISIYRVLPNKTIELINNDARQKGLTEDSAVNQLLLRADIKSDWLNVRETRSGLATLDYRRQEGQIKSLVFQIAKDKVRLECSNIDLSDICSCRP